MQSMEEIYRAHAQTVYRYLLARTGDPGLAEELTQETFYQAVRTVNRFDGSCKVTTWLCGIAKNVLRTYWKKHPASDPLEESTALTGSPEGWLLARAGQLELLAALQTLEGEMREVMYLRLLGSLSFREIGEVLSRSENWARVTYFRGKEKLKKELNSDGD